mgnify:CR=1 FL=1
MGKFTLLEVKTQKDIKQWLDFPAKLYKDDPHYVRPMDEEVEKVFDRTQNKLFRHGDATRFLLKDENGKIVGRIARKDARPCVSTLDGLDARENHINKKWLHYISTSCICTCR